MCRDLPSDHPQYIEVEAIPTPDVLNFYNKLFDTVNGSSRTYIPRRVQLNPVRNIFPFGIVKPFLFYQLALSVSPHKSDCQIFPPPLTNWIFSIHNLEYIWRKLRGKGFKYLTPRNFNQDPLENFLEIFVLMVEEISILFMLPLLLLLKLCL